MEELSDREKEFLLQITRQGIDLEEVIKAFDKLVDTLKPIIELYIKNINTYMKYKGGHNE